MAIDDSPTGLPPRKYEKSHFEPDTEYETWGACTDPGHAAPTHLHVPPGQVYVHICPSCGKRVRIHGNHVRW